MASVLSVVGACILISSVKYAECELTLRRVDRSIVRDDDPQVHVLVRARSSQASRSRQLHIS